MSLHHGTGRRFESLGYYLNTELFPERQNLLLLLDPSLRFESRGSIRWDSVLSMDFPWPVGFKAVEHLFTARHFIGGNKLGSIHTNLSFRMLKIASITKLYLDGTC